MSTPFHLILERSFYRAMILHAQAEHPNECCGLLGGFLTADGASGGIARVTRRFPLVNALASPIEYDAEPKGLLQASRVMREAGIDMLAIYHSHPTSPPIPSRKDISRNMGMDVTHFIISLQSLRPEVKAWRLGEDDFREASWELA